MMLNMNFSHIVDQTTKKIKAQTVKINDLFEMKMIILSLIISDSMNKTADSITSNYASEFVTVKT